MSSQGLSSHGVHFDANQFVIFLGDTYNPAAIDNEVYEIANTINISSSGNNEVVFSVGEGLPDSQPVITITTSNNKSKSIIINSLGIANVN